MRTKRNITGIAVALILLMLIMISNSCTAIKATPQEQETFKNYKPITFNDLQPGDVLCCEGNRNSFVSRAISFLTNSCITHAAMAYNSKDGTLIEENSPCVQVAPIDRYLQEGRNVFVKRIDKTRIPASTTLKKLQSDIIKISEEYLNDATPYDYAEVITFALLLLSKQYYLDEYSQGIASKVLKKFADDWQVRFKKFKMEPTVCSQFVYNCYYDGRYQLEGPLLLTSPSSPNSNASSLFIGDKGHNNLLGLAYNTLNQPKSKKVYPLGNNEPVTESYEDLAQQFVNHTDNNNTRNNFTVSNRNTINVELAEQINRIGNIFASYDQQKGFASAENANTSGIQYLRNNKDKLNFIAPVDLLNTTNTVIVGVLKGKK